MEENQELKNKPMHICSTNIWQGIQEYLMAKMASSNWFREISMFKCE